MFAVFFQGQSNAAGGVSAAAAPLNGYDLLTYNGTLWSFARADLSGENLGQFGIGTPAAKFARVVQGHLGGSSPARVINRAVGATTIAQHVPGQAIYDNALTDWTSSGFAPPKYAVMIIGETDAVNGTSHDAFLASANLVFGGWRTQWGGSALKIGVVLLPNNAGLAANTAVIRAALTDAASANSATLINVDAYAANPTAHPEWFDGTHWTEAGYEILGTLIANALEPGSIMTSHESKLPGALNIDPSAAAPKITQPTAASGAGASLSVVAQAAAASSGLAGGDLVLAGGAGDGAGAAGKVAITSATLGFSGDATVSPIGKLTLDTTGSLAGDGGTVEIKVGGDLKIGIGANNTGTRTSSYSTYASQPQLVTVGCAHGSATFTAKGGLCWAQLTNTSAQFGYAGGAGGAASLTLDAGTGGISVGTTADARTTNMLTGNAAQTLNVCTHATPANVITIGGAASTTTIGGVAKLPGTARTTTAPTNATTNMSALSDLSVTVVAGQRVTGTFTLFAKDSTGADGLKFDLAGGNATWTSIQFGFVGAAPGATLGVSTSTAIGTALTATLVSTSDQVYQIAFAGVVNAGGTLIPQFAQVSHSTGTATVEVNSYIQLFTSSN